MKTQTLTLRVRGLYNEDGGKSHVRLYKEHMEKLGVKSGDIVKVHGTKTTGAKCFPLEADYKQAFDANFLFLDETSKSVPFMRMSAIVSSNARGGDTGSLVEISRAEAVQASKVILA